MKVFKSVFMLLIASLTIHSAFAKVTEGADYTVLKTPIKSVSPDKIELIEVFSYACSHCQAFNPILEGYLKTIPKDVSFRQIHVYWDPKFLNLIRINQAVTDTNSSPANNYIFKALLNENVNLFDEKSTINWLNAQTNFDGKKIAASYLTPANKAKAQDIAKLTTQYSFQSTPTIIVGGKYRLNLAALKSQADVPRVLNGLIDLSRKANTPIKTIKNPGAELATKANKQ